MLSVDQMTVCNVKRVCSDDKRWGFSRLPCSFQHCREFRYLLAHCYGFYSLSRTRLPQVRPLSVPKVYPGTNKQPCLFPLSFLIYVQWNLMSLSLHQRRSDGCIRSLCGLSRLRQGGRQLEPPRAAVWRNLAASQADSAFHWMWYKAHLRDVSDWQRFFFFFLSPIFHMDDLACVTVPWEFLGSVRVNVTAVFTPHPSPLSFHL